MNNMSKFPSVAQLNNEQIILLTKGLVFEKFEKVERVIKTGDH